MRCHTKVTDLRLPPRLDRHPIRDHLATPAPAGNRHEVRPERRSHAGQRLHTSDDVLDPLSHGLGRLVLLARHQKPHRHQRGHVNADAGRLQLEKAPDEERRAHEEHEREGNLRHDQPVPEAIARRVRAGAAPAVLERAVEIGTERVHGRHEAEQQAREHGHGACIEHDAPAHAPVDVVGHRVLGRNRRGEPLETDVRKPHADRHAGDREEHALGEELSGNAPAPCTERGPDGDLPLPDGGARQQEVGHVGARDEQHERDRPHHREHDEPNILGHQHVSETDCGDTPSLVLEVGHRQPRGRARKVRAGIIQGGAWRQPGDHVEKPLVASGGVLHGGKRHPELRELGKLKRSRHDAHDGVGQPVDGDRSADDGRIGQVAPLPHAVSEEDDARRARLVFVPAEVPAEYRVDPKHREKIRRDKRPEEPLGLVAVGHRHAAILHGRDLGERARPGLVVLQVEPRHPGFVDPG